MKLDLIPDLPPRAKKAIVGRFGDTLESLGGLTLADVARLSGVGDAALDALIAAGWEPKSASADFAASQEPEEPVTPGDLEQVVRPAWLSRLAETFLLKIAERQALTPQAVAFAWEAALAFVQESRRAEGAEILLFDDLRVRLHGADFLVKTRIPAGEEVPEGSRRVLLVPVQE